MTSKKDYKIWTAVEDGPGIMATPEKVSVVSNQKNYMTINKNGVLLMGGSITFGTSGEKMTQGGFFAPKPDMAQMIPSSTMTANSGLSPSPPMGFASSIMKDMPFFLSMLG